MDATLIQIINEWVATQDFARRLQQRVAQLEAQVAELQKPKVEPVTSSNGKAPVDTQVGAEQSA